MVRASFRHQRRRIVWIFEKLIVSPLMVSVPEGGLPVNSSQGGSPLG